jgi:hypothetical protein
MTELTVVHMHEAAHAVIALRLGIAVDTINLNPNDAYARKATTPLKGRSKK